MIDRNTPSDPRLRERRGDLVGWCAVGFAGLVLVVLAGVAFVLLGGFPGGGGAQASASARPSSVAGRSPSTSAPPSVAPSASAIASSPPVVAATIGTPAQLVFGGQPVGNVTVGPPDYKRRLNGARAPAGQRWAIVPVTYTAFAPFDFRAADWQVVDAAGARHGWALTDPQPPLGAGTLERGASITGNVTFQVPAGVNVAAIVLRTEAGADLIVFRAP